MKVDDISELIMPVDEEMRMIARERTASLVMPHRAMGVINDLSEQLCAISGSMKPCVDKKALFVMAGDHGVCRQGVSAYPQEVTLAMLNMMLLGKSAVTVYANQINAAKYLVDMGTLWDVSLPENPQCIFIDKKIAKGTADFSTGPAMSREEAEKSIITGFLLADELIKDKSLNLIALGEMGIGNTTPSAAIASAILGESPENLVGRGSGLEIEGLRRKQNVVKKGLEVNRGKMNDPVDVLASVGGFEIGGLAGLVLACAANKTPVVLDGFISGAAALIAAEIAPATKGYMIAGHMSNEQGHKYILKYLGLKPLLNLEMRLGEGTGAVCAMPLVDMAAATIKEIATFEEAGI